MQDKIPPLCLQILLPQTDTTAAASIQGKYDPETQTTLSMEFNTAAAFIVYHCVCEAHAQFL